MFAHHQLQNYHANSFVGPVPTCESQDRARGSTVRPTNSRASLSTPRFRLSVFDSAAERGWGSISHKNSRHPRMSNLSKKASARISWPFCPWSLFGHLSRAPLEIKGGCVPQHGSPTRTYMRHAPAPDAPTFGGWRHIHICLCVCVFCIVCCVMAMALPEGVMQPSLPVPQRRGSFSEQSDSGSGCQASIQRCYA